MKKPEFLRWCFAGVFIFLLTSGGFAQDEPDKTQYSEEDLYDLSLEELLNVKVTTASKSEETVRDAPGVVSVVTAKEIESFGATNLNEVLDRVAGMYMTGSFVLTDNLPTIRGETNAHWATKVLVLIDGRPYRDSFLGGNLLNVLNDFPLGIVERIEVVRGPGSVLYGTNAFVGVINVILKKADENWLSTSTRYGSFNTRQTNISTGIKHNDLTVDASLNLYRTDGWRFTARDESAIVRSKTSPLYDSIVNPARTIYKDRDDIGAAVHSTYKGLSLNAFYGRTKYPAMTNGALWIVPAGGGLNATPVRFEVFSDKLFTDLGYRKEITSFYTASVNVTYNRTRFNFTRADYKNRPVVTLADDILAEWSNSFKISSNLNAITGLVINNQQGYYKDETRNPDYSLFSDNRELVNPTWFYNIPPWDETWYSGYAQFAYSPVSILKLVGGLQANKVTGIDFKYSPRFAAILNLKSGWGGKLLYGSAFRSATPGGEKSINIPTVLHGSSNLLPETINTSEIQFFVVKKKFEASVNFFYSEQHNQIIRSSKDDPNNHVPGTPQYINNNGLQTSHGVEAETKVYVSSRWKGIASFASQSADNGSGYINYGGAPLYMAKLGVNYGHPRGIDIAIFNTYYSKGGNIRAVFSTDNTPENFEGTATNANPEMKAINYMTANIQLNLPKLLVKPAMTDITLFCYMVNVLNQEVNYPEFTKRIINTYPGRAGFNIHGGISIKI